MSNKLTLLLVDGGRDRLTAAVNLAASGLALGKKVQLFLSWGALRAFASGEMDSAPLPACLGPELIARAEAELAGHTRLTDALRELREQGVKIYACSNTLHMLGIAESAIDPLVDGISGAPGFLAMSEGGQVISF